MALLLAQEDGKLSLDDKVAKFEPSLTRGGDITIRQLLSHTSGYQDYYPQDYLPPFMREPVTAQGIVDRWAKKPLDFDPAAAWQYSNTGFVVAGLVLEKATGTSAIEYLRHRIFGPLGMKTIADLDHQPLTRDDAEGLYLIRYWPPPRRDTRGIRLTLRGGRVGRDRWRPGALGRRPDQRHAPESPLLPGDDHPSAPQ